MVVVVAIAVARRWMKCCIEHNGEESFNPLRTPPAKYFISENKKIEVLDNYYPDECETTDSISSEEFAELLESSVAIQLLDVRSEEEYAQDHLANSINIPFEYLENRIKEIDLARPIYIICQSGIRSRIAQEKLLRVSSKSVIYNILGGLNRYKTLLI